VECSFRPLTDFGVVPANEAGGKYDYDNSRHHEAIISRLD